MAEYVEIDIDQGTDFSLPLTLKNEDGSPKNVNGYTFKSHIKKSFYSEVTTAEFSVDSTDASIGSIILTLSSNDTTDITPGRYVFDVKQIDTSNKVERLMEGIATINPQVTE